MILLAHKNCDKSVLRLYLEEILMSRAACQLTQEEKNPRNKKF